MRRILLDTDLAMGAPGSDIDDGFALAMALADPELSVELVTTVNGNTDVDNATVLSRQLLDRLGRPDIPVVRGAAIPLSPPPRGQDAVSRRDSSAEPAAWSGRRAAPEIVDRVMTAPGELTLVAIGPLTNVALALLLEPELAGAVREIVVMGGVFGEHTNIAAMPGEFNIWTDPHAAAVVLASGARLRFVGLDVTRQVRLTREHAAAMAQGGQAFGAFAGQCTLEWIAHHGSWHPGDPLEQDSCAMHDSLAVAVVTRPDLVTWRAAHVAVETSSPVTRGVTVADFLTFAQPPPQNCHVATAVDVDGFTDLFVDRVANL
ncbi:MAG: ribonucleoside hydrolase [Micromonosporaceae bacterium]|nr:ribonucleoside hydrolase [Micromonosporaceae bacterium]